MLFRSGDLLVVEGGDIGKSMIWGRKDPAIFQNSINRVRPRLRNDNRYLAYVLDTYKRCGWLDAVCNKSTFAHLTDEKLSNLEVPLPEPSRQRAIADHLDRETARIDALIEKKTRLIELLEEKRQALITQVVTKGLDPNVPMKDSGIEWIGQVPAHWDVTALKYAANPLDRDSFTDGDWIESPYITDHGVRLIQTGNVKAGWFRDKGSRFVSEETFQALRCTEVRPGDILICRLGDPVGRACRAPRLAEKMITSVDNVIMRVRKDYCEDYFVNLLSSSAFLNFMEASCRGATRDRVSREMLGQTRVPIPRPDEQKRISEYLNEISQRIWKLQDCSRESINLLRERRSALITAAVTGQLDIGEDA